MKRLFVALAIAMAFGSNVTLACEPYCTTPTSNPSATATAAAAGGAVTLEPGSVSGGSASADPTATATITIDPGAVQVAPVQEATSNSVAGASSAQEQSANATVGDVTGSTAITGPSTSTAGANATGGTGGEVHIAPGAVQGGAGGSIAEGAVTNENRVTNTLINQTHVAPNQTTIASPTAGATSQLNVAPGAVTGGSNENRVTATNVNNNNQSFNVNPTAGASATGGAINNSGNSTSASGSSAVTGPVNSANQGNSKSVVTVNQPVNINTPETKIPPPAAPIPLAPPANPLNVSPEGKPANLTGRTLVQAYLDECLAVYEAGVSIAEVRGTGASGLTNVVFAPHSNFAKFAKGGFWGKSEVKKVVRAKIAGLPSDQEFSCLGLVMAEAKPDKKVGLVTDMSIILDSVQFIASQGGFEEVYLIDTGIAFSANSVTVTEGSGIGAAPGASGFINALATLTLGVTLNSNDGASSKQQGVGNWHIVVSPDCPDGAQRINMRSLAERLSATTQQAGAVAPTK